MMAFPMESETLSETFLSDQRQALAAPDVVDDFLHALAQRCVLKSELLHDAPVVDHEVAGGGSAARLLLEADVGVGEDQMAAAF